MTRESVAPFVVRVASIAAPATVQDGGRPGAMHAGVPPGGALVPELLARANRALGNRWDAPALESLGGLALVRDEGPLTLSIDGRALHAPAATVLEVPRPAQHRVQYI